MVSKQCFACGYDWHDPNNVVQRGTNQGVDEVGIQMREARQQSTPNRVPPVIQPPPQTLRQPQRVQTQQPAAQQRQNVKLEGLELDKFAPMDSDEAKRLAKSLGRPSWLNPWFGRRDLIPPVEDQRTLLIDRQMVAEGFVTPEELVELHKIGAEMDRIRPDLAHAKLAADQAVQRSREEHEQLVARKKAEAEERKKQRKAQIEHRKQNDIVFLGRGVSKGLSDRKSNVEKLQQNKLPLLSTPADVANAMELSIPRLRWLAFHTETSERPHYISFNIAKKNGGVRQLAAPHKAMKAAQMWILNHVLANIPVHDAAHGFVRGRSSLSGAQAHVNASVLVNADLEDFFPSINVFRVIGLFRSFGYSPAVATIFALLVTECPRTKINFQGQSMYVATGPRCLPQGACTSPAISNLIAYKLDRRFESLTKKMGWNYTRYADDLSFSCNEGGGDQVGYVMARIRHICQDEGFAVNESKTRILRPSNRQTVTGIVVNEKPNIDRQTIRKIRAILHNAKRTGLDAQNRNNHPDFRRWLNGMISYISMVNAEKGKQLKSMYDQLAT